MILLQLTDFLLHDETIIYEAVCCLKKKKPNKTVGLL